MATANLSRTTLKTLFSARIHSANLLELHDTLYSTKKSESTTHESRGKAQDKNSDSYPETAKAFDSKPKTPASSSTMSEIKKDMAAIFGNKIKKAQRTLSKEDLANAYDL
ncbi:hypothetical protein VTL71DRAFT_5612 [Oculimacula yallundae]|uniref:Uncharacterized protein n=1 Tax=Oculimacula yallundae TaxID=86028 RepID=A0ABR4C292_9HELO